MTAFALTDPTMQALVYTAPNRIELHDVARPAAQDGSVRLRVDAVGICGSDLHAFKGHDPRRNPPLDAQAAAAQVGEFGGLRWVEERTLADGAAAFADLVSGRVGAAKILLRPRGITP